MKHGLVGEGAPFDMAGNRLDWWRTSGVGFGRCACGEQSPTELPSGAARKRWHREHKQAVT